MTIVDYTSLSGNGIPPLKLKSPFSLPGSRIFQGALESEEFINISLAPYTLSSQQSETGCVD